MSSSSNSWPRGSSKWGNASMIARRAIENRVAGHEQSLIRKTKDGLQDTTPPSVLMVEHLVDWRIGFDIPAEVAEAHIWRCHSMPYHLLYRALLRIRSYVTWEDCSALLGDPKIDEWILLNEKWLRDHDHCDGHNGLVTLSDAGIVFPNSVLTETARIIFRLDHLPGYQIMSLHRQRCVRIPPSTDDFRHNFHLISDGLLNNLDWGNVLVAGGIVLGALVTFGNDEYQYQHPGQWILSDIDIYLYGLSTAAANEKIKHIFDVFRSNIPPQMRALAIRNSRTITFYANYPLRRIQIVLKLVKSPREALLNFDLDICAMGWDGTNVLMLPRAARALETGSNTFTMNLIQGHYLCDRRASQPHRIFKYAEKGYGIRFLPSYLSSVNQSPGCRKEDGPYLDIPLLADEARNWIRMQLETEPFEHTYLKRTLRSSSILSGFIPLMRHAAFWEMGYRLEELFIERNDSASTSYEDTYDNIPNLQYQWNEAFNHSRFRTHIVHSNMNDMDNWVRTDSEHRLQRYGVFSGDDLNNARRMTFASTITDLLQSTNDIQFPVLLPGDFAAYVNELVNQAQVTAGLPEKRMLEPIVKRPRSEEEVERNDQEELFMWTISPQLMWQQLDRRIDEVFEVLHTFRRANHPLSEDLQLQRLTAELSRRHAWPRNDIRGEFEAFAQWIGHHAEL